MFTLIVGIIIFVAVLLVLVVLAQNSKGGGLSNQFGGPGASNIIGVKKTGDLLEKLTWGFVITIMILALSTNFVTQNTGSSNELLNRAGESSQAPQMPVPSSTETAPADTAK
jgi:preprotein translocase subunit SecG